MDISHIFDCQALMNVIRTHAKTVASVETWRMLTSAIVLIQAALDITVKSVSKEIYPQ